MEGFKGIIPALYTPFDNNGRLNIKSAKRHISFLLKAGCTGLFISGSTGEGFYQTLDERMVIDEVRGKMDVVVHVGAVDLRQAVELAKFAGDIGASGISSVLPIYYPHTLQDIRCYYKELNSACDLPLLVYYLEMNRPGFTARQFLDAVGDLSNLWGVKYTSPDLFQMQLISILSEGRLQLFGGYDQMALCSFAMGARGVIGSSYNFIPEPYIKIYNAFVRSNLKAAVQAQREANKLLDRLKTYGYINMGKAALKLRGIDVGQPRPPMVPLNSEEVEQLKKILTEHGFLKEG
jgi:N-acetylneuraminate lyase